MAAAEPDSDKQVAIVRPILKTKDALSELESFETMKSRLLVTSDYQKISGKNFIKKSGWRKLALVFNISDQVMESSKTVREDGSFVWSFRVRALAPNGRFTEAVASCDSRERKYAHIEHDVQATSQCVPIDAEILTRDGFKYFTDLKIGQEVLAFSPAEDRCIWTPLRNITAYDNLAMVKLANTSFNVLCTPDHSWAILKQQRKTTLSRRTPRIELRKAMNLRKGTSLIVAAKAEDGDSLLTPDEAAILGWLLTDGTMRQYNVGRYGPYIRLHIDQSKTKYVSVLRKLLGDNSTEYIADPPNRTFPQGHTSVLMQTHRFNIRAKFGTTLLRKAGINDVVNLRELPEVVTRLSFEAREAMLIAMLQGDGTLHGGKNWIFGVKDPNIIETFQILATLQGYRLGKLQHCKYDILRQSIITSRYLDASKLRIENQATMPAWCPTTDYGTWVMRYRGQITITGNTRAKSRAISDLIGAGEVSAEEMVSDSNPSKDLEMDLSDEEKKRALSLIHSAKEIFQGRAPPVEKKLPSPPVEGSVKRFEFALDQVPYPVDEEAVPFSRFFLGKICKSMIERNPHCHFELERDAQGRATAIVWYNLDEVQEREIARTLSWSLRKIGEKKSTESR